ncbi:fibronectin type III domain-containing protein [Candidatus Poribacteria bacterium]|nr:fibronectin type III domain-containing protein [Candidatus Poribacteria bacterium]
MQKRFAFQAQVFIYLIILGSLLASSLTSFAMINSSITSVEKMYDNDSSLDYFWTSASGPVDHYNIYVSVNGGNFVLFDITEDATPVYTLEGAENTFTYQITVQAADAFGNTGPQSDPSDPVTVDLTTPTLTQVQAADVTDTTVTITWTTDEAADSQVEYGLGTTYGMSTPLDATLVSSHSAQITQLTPNTVYHYRVLSEDAAGNLATSDDFTFTTDSPPDTTPPTLTNIQATDLTDTTVTITWTTDEAADSQVEYGLNTTYGNLTPLDAELVSSHSVPINELTANTMYHYRVLSKDAAGNLATSDNFTFTTTTNIPRTVTLQVIDGYDQKNGVFLARSGQVSLVQASDNKRLSLEKSSFVSFQFENNVVPPSATIQSVKILIEHYQDKWFKESIRWQVGTLGMEGLIDENANILTMLDPAPIHSHPRQEQTDVWDVSGVVTIAAEVNDLKLVIRNNDRKKRSKQDHIRVEITYLNSLPAAPSLISRTERRTNNALIASTITSPQDHAILTGTIATIQGSASSNDSSIEKIMVSTDGGGTWQVADGTTRWSFNWILPQDGEYQVLSKAIDPAGGVSFHASIPVKVDNTKPVVTALKVTEEVLKPGTVVTLTAVVSDATSGLAAVM